MRMFALKRVTIVAEAVLEDRIIRDIRRLGAKGYTVIEVRGEGSRGVRASEWEGGNVKIETLVSPQVSASIVSLLAETYFPQYAVVAYVDDVEVVRGDKYI